MPLFESFAARFARPAGRVLDAPIRDIVHEVLKEHGYASPAEVQALRDELRDLRVRVEGLDRKVADVSKLGEKTQAELVAAYAALDAAKLLAEEARNQSAAALTEAEAARAEAAEAAEPHTHVADPRITALEAEIARLKASLEAVPVAAPAAPAAPAPAPEPAPAPAAPSAPVAAAPAPAHAAPRNCKVEGCEEAVRSKGFCSAHYQQWRRGTLKGFVSAEGTIQVEGRVLHLPSSAIGGAVTTDGGRVLVDGHDVAVIAAS